MDMLYSYKPVFLSAVFDAVDSKRGGKTHGRCRKVSPILRGRNAARLPWTRCARRLARIESLDDGEVSAGDVKRSFEKLEGANFMRYDRDLAFIRFEPALWDN